LFKFGDGLVLLLMFLLLFLLLDIIYPVVDRSTTPGRNPGGEEPGTCPEKNNFLLKVFKFSNPYLYLFNLIFRISIHCIIKKSHFEVYTTRLQLDPLLKKERVRPIHLPLNSLYNQNVGF